MTTLYLNNDGSKWIEVSNRSSLVSGWQLDRSPMDFMLCQLDGTVVKRRADYYESFGNFATVSFRIKGIRYSGFFDSFDRINGLPVLRRYSRVYSKKECIMLASFEDAIERGIELSDTQTQNYHDLADNHKVDMNVRMQWDTNTNHWTTSDPINTIFDSLE